MHPASSARARFTDAARAEAESMKAQMVDLERLDADLRLAFVNLEDRERRGIQARRVRVRDYGFVSRVGCTSARLSPESGEVKPERDLR